jgi:saxitoxin biosynthesis operon SxtJ-like protein
MPIGGKNLFSISQYRNPSRKQLRSFGLIVAAGFLIIGSWPLIFRHQSPRMWALAISLIFGAGGLLVPTALRQAYRVWMTAGELLGWVNSKVILGGLYYLLLTPIKVLMTFAGHDPMNRAFDRKAATYRVNRKVRPVSHMTHQF